MLFSSFSFLFVFFPIVVILYYVFRFNKNAKNFVLLVASLLFYAWGEPRYVLLMISMIIISYIFALLIQSYRKPRKKKSLKIYLLIAAIGINLLLLVYFKYFNFILENVNLIFSTNFEMGNVVLPIGISFYSFQIISYLIDVYRKKVKAQKNFLTYACYVSLFPQLIAGPIVRYKDVAKQMDTRVESLKNVAEGLRRFVIGLGKKIIISNNVAIVANDIFSMTNDEITTSIAWLGAISFSLQIYFDFSGYSDMAIGLGKIFGFKFLENFNYPYIATSITDFWRRWHMSLSSWFKDYVYIPLGGSKLGLKRQIINLAIVWALTGLWHGAAWNFVIWGLYFFIILVIEKVFLLKYLNKVKGLNNIYTAVMISIGWVIFNCNSIDQILVFVGSMVNIFNFEFNIFETLNALHLIPYFIIGLICSLPIVPYIKNKFKDNIWLEFVADIYSICIFVMCILFLVNNSYNPFIYFRF